MPSHIPAYDLPAHNRQVRLARRPDGVPQSGDFDLATTPVPKPATGQFLVRNIYLSVDPAQRGWASAVANYSEPVALGAPMRALAVGIIVDSANADFKEGQFVYGWFGWQLYALADAAHVVWRCTQDVPLTAFASLLGINGVTAFLGLTALGRPIAGETLLVSTAAGSVGSFVGQIGARMGCRTIGLTGDDSKVARCTARYNYDVAINYKTVDLKAAIAAAAPKGIDVYFDNTGGTILDIVLRQMNVAGRIVQCGTASVADWTVNPSGPRNEREILTRRLVWSGFVIFDHFKRYGTAVEELVRLYGDGDLVYDVDIAEGLDHAPHAIAGLYAGENSGKMLIFVG